MKHLRLKFGTARNGSEVLQVGRVISVSDEEAKNYMKSNAWEDFTEQYVQVKEKEVNQENVDKTQDSQDSQVSDESKVSTENTVESENDTTAKKAKK